MTDATGRRTLLYGRTSDDESEGRSVDDQLAEQRRWAEETRRTVVAELRDDGISASRYAKRRKSRPDWQKAMEYITAGQIDELSVWEVSRSTRDRAVWSALIAACIENHVDMAVGGKVHDPADPDDGFMLDLGAALAVREVAVLSKRVKRAVDSRAAAGRPHGSLTYGYKREIDLDTGKTIGRIKHPDQAPVVREIADRLLAGETANSVAADLNRREIPTAHGGRWRGGNLLKLVVRPTFAGLRVHDGKVLPEVRGEWPAILSEEEHYQLVALTTDPTRDRFRGDKRVRYLGTGSFRCGRDGCDGRMRVVVTWGNRPAYYDCRVCHRIARHQESVDEYVTAVVVERLSRPDILERLARSAQAGVKQQKAAEEIERQRGKLRAARVAWDEDKISLEAYADMEKRALAKIEAAEEVARTAPLPSVVFDVAGDDAAARWEALPVRDRRAVVAALMDVTLMPVGNVRGRPIEEGIAVAWRG